jgi:hypothetical protein
MRRMPGKLARDSGLSAEEEIVRVIKSVLGRFQQEATTRLTRLSDMNSKFGLLLDTQTLMSKDLDVQHVLRQKCLVCGNFYATGVDGKTLCTEICDCKMQLNANIETLPLPPLDRLSFIVSFSDDIFFSFSKFMHCLSNYANIICV